MTTIADIIRHVETLTGHPLNRTKARITAQDERRCAAPWSAGWPRRTPSRPQDKQQAELIIRHESLYYPYNAAIKQR